MKPSAYLMLAGFPILFSACGGDDFDDTATLELADTMATAATPMDAEPGNMAGMMTIALQPLNDSGTSGDAMIHASGDALEVVVQLTGAPEGERPGHIHSGTCENLGGVVQPLQSVSVGADGTGTSTSSVSMDMSQIADGQHVVNYHGEGGTPIACGAIPMQEM